MIFYCLTPNGVRLFSGVLFPINILLLRSKCVQKELAIMQKNNYLTNPKVYWQKKINVKTKAGDASFSFNSLDLTGFKNLLGLAKKNYITSQKALRKTASEAATLSRSLTLLQRPASGKSSRKQARGVGQEMKNCLSRCRR